MKKYLTKRNIYIFSFTILYLLCGIVSLIHSFAFFGLANNYPMAIMLGTCFEIGQVAVLMSLLTSKKEQSRVMPYLLLILLTAVQILGNVFSSYKYLMIHSVRDLVYFKTPIFVWTDLPDNITTVIVTWIIGSILPLVSLAMTSMVSNYIMDTDPEDNKKLTADVVANVIDNHKKEKVQETENIDNKKIEKENDSSSKHGSEYISNMPITEHNEGKSEDGGAKEEKSTEDEESENQSESERNVTNHFVNI